MPVEHSSHWPRDSADSAQKQAAQPGTRARERTDPDRPGYARTGRQAPPAADAPGAPQASISEVNAMVRAWLAESPQNGSLRLPSRGPLSARSGVRDRHATIRV